MATTETELKRQAQRKQLLERMMRSRALSSIPTQVVRGVFLSSRAVKSGEGGSDRAQLGATDDGNSSSSPTSRFGPPEVS